MSSDGDVVYLMQGEPIGARKDGSGMCVCVQTAVGSMAAFKCSACNVSGSLGEPTTLALKAIVTGLFPSRPGSLSPAPPPLLT